MRRSTAAWSFDAKGVIAGLQALAEKPVELARPAAYAAARTFYDQTVKNAAAISPGEDGTGRLADSIYHVWSKDNATDNKAVYHVSWNKTSKRGAPHGYLLEFGYNRRYQAIKLRDGSWITLRSPKARRERWPKPGRGASQAEKDAYWMPRKNGPSYHLGNFFLRNAYRMAYESAVQAAQQEFANQVRARLAGKA